MPRLRTKPKKAEPEPKRFQFELAVCVEAFRLGFTEEVPRGRVWPKDHRLVTGSPEYWRLLGPRLDEEEV